MEKLFFAHELEYGIALCQEIFKEKVHLNRIYDRYGMKIYLVTDGQFRLHWNQPGVLMLNQPDSELWQLLVQLDEDLHADVLWEFISNIAPENLLYYVGLIIQSREKLINHVESLDHYSDHEEGTARHRELLRENSREIETDRILFDVPLIAALDNKEAYACPKCACSQRALTGFVATMEITRHGEWDMSSLSDVKMNDDIADCLSTTHPTEYTYFSIPREKGKSLIFEDNRTCCISTGHIAESDNDLLQLYVQPDATGTIVAYELTYGYLVYLDDCLLDNSEGYIDSLTNEGFSESFISLLHDARKEGWRYMNLDQDGPFHADRITFDW